MAHRLDDDVDQRSRSASEYSWSKTRDKAIGLFGTGLSAALEAELLDVFATSPARVVAEIEDVGAKFKAGLVRSPWGILRARLTAADRPELVVVDGSERERRVARARAWLRAAGYHFDREPEVLDELFEHGGDRAGPLLGPWRDDDQLREEMLELWRERSREAA